MVEYLTNYRYIHRWILLQSSMVHSYPVTERSYSEKKKRYENSTDKPHSIEWNYVMIGTSHLCPPFCRIRMSEVRKYCQTWPNL
jgi:hypothetical protein